MSLFFIWWPHSAPTFHPPSKMGTMSDTLSPCPVCNCEYTYELGELLVCPECAHEWSPTEDEGSAAEAQSVIKDAVGNILSDGDTVSIVKTMKVKGSPQDLKIGTKVRNIRLISPVNGHDIDAKVDGFGPMKLKSSIVKKV
ncbi:protein PhnA [Arthrobacter sp. UYCu511]